MIIENSTIGLSSQTEFTFKHTQEKITEISNVQQTQRAVYEYEDYMSLEDLIQKLIIEKLLNINILPNKKFENNPSSQNPNNPYEQQRQLETTADMTVYTQENYYQKQTVEFAASAQIQTPNQTFDLSLNLSFSKELYESRSSKMIMENVNLTDPLIINFDKDINPFDNLSDLRFEFDLDSDGSSELIPQLKKGAGYLALDKNENGTIDNGNELFGPNTGKGFKELAQYDEDNNNWIDEKDSVFGKLKVWSIDDNGNHSLVSLIDSNVGAIYLGDIHSGFRYQNAINNTQAIQKSNGVFVKEDGSGLGVVNSIDIVV